MASALALLAIGFWTVVMAGASSGVAVTLVESTGTSTGPFADGATYDDAKAWLAPPSGDDPAGFDVALPIDTAGFTASLSGGSAVFDDATQSVALPATVDLGGSTGSVTFLVLGTWADATSTDPSVSIGARHGDVTLPRASGGASPVFDDLWMALSPTGQDWPLASTDGAFNALVTDFYPDDFTIESGASLAGDLRLASVLGAETVDVLGYATDAVAELRVTAGGSDLVEATSGLFDEPIDLSGLSLNDTATVPAPGSATDLEWLEVSSDLVIDLAFDGATDAVTAGVTVDLDTTAAELGGSETAPRTFALAGDAAFDGTTASIAFTGTTDPFTDFLGASWMDLTSPTLSISADRDDEGALTLGTSLSGTLEVDSDPPSAEGPMTFDIVAMLEGSASEITSSFDVTGAWTMGDLARLHSIIRGTDVAAPSGQALVLNGVGFSWTSGQDSNDFSLSASATILGEFDSAGDHVDGTGIVADVFATVVVATAADDETESGNVLLLGLQTDRPLTFAEVFEHTGSNLSGTAVGEVTIPVLDFTVAVPLDASVERPLNIDLDDLADKGKEFFRKSRGLDVVQIHVDQTVSIGGDFDAAQLGSTFVDAVGLQLDGDGKAIIGLEGSAGVELDFGGDNSSIELTGLDLRATLPTITPPLPEWLPAATISNAELGFSYADGGSFVADVAGSLTTDIDGHGAAEVVDLTFLVGREVVDTTPVFTVAASAAVGSPDGDGNRSDTWADPFGSTIALTEPTASFAYSSGGGSTTVEASLSAGVTVASGITVEGSLDLVVDGGVSGVLQAALVIADGTTLTFEDMISEAASGLGVTYTPNAATQELELLEITGGSLTVSFGDVNSASILASTTYRGLAGDLLASVGPDGLLFGFKATPAGGDVTIGDLFSELDVPAPLSGFTLPTLVTTVSTTDLDTSSSDLDREVFDFFKGVHGCEDAATQEDADCLEVFDALQVASGFSLVASIPMPTELDQIKEELWIGDDPVLLRGTVPLFGSGAFSFEIILPPISPPVGQAEWFDSGQLSVALEANVGAAASVSMEVTGEITVKIPKSETAAATGPAGFDLLTFDLSASVQAGTTGATIALEGGLTAQGTPWSQPFGIEWLEVSALRLRLELAESGVGLGFRGKVMVGTKDLDASILIRITPALGIPELVGVRAASRAGLGLEDLVWLQSQLAGGADPLGLEELPGVSVKNVELSYARVSTPSLCLEPGIVVGGDLYVNATSAPNAPEGEPGDCQAIAAQPAMSTWCIDNTDQGCLASVRLEVSDSGIVANGQLGAFSIGPAGSAINLPTAALGLSLTESLQQLKISGSASIDGFMQGHLSLLLKPTELSFIGDFEIFDLFQAYLEATATVDPSNFDLSAANFQVRGFIRNAFGEQIRSLTAPAFAELRRVFRIIDPLWTQLTSGSIPNPLQLINDTIAALETLGEPVPQILKDIDDQVRLVNKEIKKVEDVFREAGIPVPSDLRPTDIVDVALKGFTLPAFPGADIGFVPRTCIGTVVGGKCYLAIDPPQSPTYKTICAPWPWEDECERIKIWPGSSGTEIGFTPRTCLGVEQGGKCYALGLVPIQFPPVPGLCAAVGIPNSQCSVGGLANRLVRDLFGDSLAEAIGLDSSTNLDPIAALNTMRDLILSGELPLDITCVHFDVAVSAALDGEIDLGILFAVFGNEASINASWDFDRPGDSAVDLFEDIITGAIFGGGTPAGGPCADAQQQPPAPVVTPPTNLVLTGATITEGGTATVNGSFESAGSTHVATVNWGDGTEQTFDLGTSRQLGGWTHTYPDDGASGTSSHNYVVSVTVTNPGVGSAAGQTNVTVQNVVPVLTAGLSSPTIDEDGVLTVSGSFTDPGSWDTHRVTVDWGDGSTPSTHDVAAGAVKAFSLSHQYLDDDPTGTPQDDYTVVVTVDDDDLGRDQESLTPTVANVAPAALTLDFATATGTFSDDFSIDEDGTVTLTGSFTDVGTLDRHSVSINWGDGSPSATINLPSGVHDFSASHQYLDDDPTGTSQDTYGIVTTVTDDDLGVVSDTTQVTVHNVAPSNLQLFFGKLEMDEGEKVVLQGSFDDPGTLDSHTIMIGWGDGTQSATLPLAVGERDFELEHRYPDDDPTGTPRDTFDLTVTLLDDDLGAADQSGILFWQATVDEDGNLVTEQLESAAPVVTIANVVPELSLQLTNRIDENDTATLVADWTDFGILDTHEITVDWGDGSPVETYDVTDAAALAAAGVVVDVAGAIEGPVNDRLQVRNTLTFTHQYLDDDPTGTFVDQYVVTVGVVDDDTGATQETAVITVDDVAPVVVATPTTQAPQYSDPMVPVTFTAYDVAADTLEAKTTWSVDGSAFVSGLPADLGFVADGCVPGGEDGSTEPRQSCTWTVSGLVDVAPGDYVIRIEVEDDDTLSTTFDVLVDVQPEDARVHWTGPTIAAGEPDSGVVTVPLRATIRDITLETADPATDPYPGDIRHAIVDFVDRASGDVLCTVDPVPLVFADEIGLGTAACDWAAPVGPDGDAVTTTVGMVVRGWYVRDSAADDVDVVVSGPVGEATTGGGEFLVDRSAGIRAADEGSLLNFGFNASFNNKRPPRLHGNVNVKYVHAGRDFKIDLTSLRTIGVVPATKKSAGSAQYEGLAKLRDLSLPSDLSVLGSELPFQMRLVDGDPDQIEFTLWAHDGQLLFSTAWGDVSSLPTTLRDGSLKARD